jgi:hypothetical protein
VGGWGEGGRASGRIESTTTILSASTMVLKRCAINTAVLPAATSFKFVRISLSVWESKLDVACGGVYVCVCVCVCVCVNV